MVRAQGSRVVRVPKTDFRWPGLRQPFCDCGANPIQLRAMLRRVVHFVHLHAAQCCTERSAQQCVTCIKTAVVRYRAVPHD